MLHPYPAYFWHWSAKLTEVPDTGMKVIQKLHKFWVRVWVNTPSKYLGYGGKYPGYGSVRTLKNTTLHIFIETTRFRCVRVGETKLPIIVCQLSEIRARFGEGAILWV